MNRGTPARKHADTYMHVHLYTEMHTNKWRRKKGRHSRTAKHQISKEQNKRKDQNVVRRRRRGEQHETAGKGAAELKIESINFKLM